MTGLEHIGLLTASAGRRRRMVSRTRMKVLGASNKHFLITATLVAAVLHFVWENIQCPLLYTHGSYDASILGMSQATLGDVVITWILYGWASLVAGRWHWMNGRPLFRGWLALEGGAILVGVLIEWHALATGRWSYLETMPTVPGLDVGLVPIFQLMILTPVSIALTEWWLCRGRLHRCQG